MLESFTAINIVNSKQSYVWRLKEEEKICTLRENERNRKTCVEGYFEIENLMLNYMFSLTRSCRMESPILISRPSPFPILGLLCGNFYFVFKL